MIERIKFAIQSRLPWNQISTKPRIIAINLSSLQTKERFPSNHIVTSKYNIFTFLPKNLFEQFSRLANVLFLFIMCLQLFTGLSPTGRYGYLISLCPLVAVQMLKDGVEDLVRHWNDRKTNTQNVLVLNRNSGFFERRSWKSVKVGDLVQVNGDEQIPADIVAIHARSSDTEGKCFVETSQLDGETNLKQKMPLYLSQKFFTCETDLLDLSAAIECDQPNKNLYSFNGTATFYLASSTDTEPQKIAILYDNLLLRGTRLKSTKYIYGIVVYTGAHTKILMNSRALAHKRSKLEYMINILVITMFIIQFTMSVVGAIAATVLGEQSEGHWYLSTLYDRKNNVGYSIYEGLVTFFLLLNNFVPISVLASLEMTKLIFSKIYIDKDEEMKCTETGIYSCANNSQIPEELGQIKMVFSDKTGTLTKNIMNFKKFWLPSNERYGVYDDVLSEREDSYVHISPETAPSFNDDRVTGGRWRLQDNADQFFDMFLLLALCHTVTPEIKNNELVYQASSPDELSLVRFAADMNFKLIARTEHTITIECLDEYTQEPRTAEFQVLNILHFNSDRKRMSVVVRVLDVFKEFQNRVPVGQIVLLTKGADEVMIKLVDFQDEYERMPVNEALGEFATEGLRTLICAKKELSDEEYFTWLEDHFTPANLALENRQELLDSAASKIEYNMELVSVSAIEDELQDQVAQTIEQLRKAGIQVYMLTGDKQETAITIARSCALIDDNMRLIFMTVDDLSGSDKFFDKRDAFIRLKSRIELEIEALDKARRVDPDISEDIALVTNGATLELLFTPFDIEIERVKPIIYETFMDLCMRCKTVVCARTSPSQKAKIVMLAQKYVKNNRTLSIGDGSNDIPMIQSANVGVGIRGKEGLQASRAADFAIGEFRFLERLLLIHGRNNYRRIAKLVLHTVYKNVANQSVQFFFAFFSRFSGSSAQVGILLLLFNLLFATVPMTVHSIFDKELPDEKAKAFPELYREGQRDMHMNIKVILFWIADGFYHGLICFFLPYAMFTAMPIDPSSGRELDWQYFSLIISTSIVLVVSHKAALEMYSYNIISVLAVLSTLPIWFTWLFFWFSIPKLAKENSNMVYEVLQSPLFWLGSFLTSTVAILLDLIWKCVSRALPFSRKLYHAVQELPDGLSHQDMRILIEKEFDLRNYALE